jgi:hypothetical protein
MNKEVKTDGYQLLHEGYQPKKQRGTQPKAPQENQQVTPPNGGSGSVKPPSNTNGKDKK